MHAIRTYYWADGPKSEYPPGHEAVFAQAPGKGTGRSWANTGCQEPTAVTPPLPSTRPGTGTFSAAGRTVRLQFYGDNNAFNSKVIIPRGSSKI